jgi:hypothetical protein
MWLALLKFHNLIPKLLLGLYYSLLKMLCVGFPYTVLREGGVKSLLAGVTS